MRSVVIALTLSSCATTVARGDDGPVGGGRRPRRVARLTARQSGQRHALTGRSSFLILGRLLIAHRPGALLVERFGHGLADACGRRPGLAQTDALGVAQRGAVVLDGQRGGLVDTGTPEGIVASGPSAVS